MPRPQRLNIAGIPQHVTQRGNNRNACFFDDIDRLTYLSIACEAAFRRKCLIHAYVLMTNHVHLLVTPCLPDGVSLLMQDIGRKYVRYINGKHQRTGTLWEGRFKSSLVDSTTYCLVCYRYIELNPVRAKMAESPGEYRWSSYHANACGQLDQLITPHEEWLALGKDHIGRFTSYRALFVEELPKSDLEAIRKASCKGLVLGVEPFKEKLELRLGIKLGTGKIGRPAKTT